MVESLIAAGADLNIVTKNGWNAVAYAVAYMPEMLDDMMKRNVNLNFLIEGNRNIFDLIRLYGTQSRVPKKLAEIYKISEQLRQIVISGKNKKQFVRLLHQIKSDYPQYEDTIITSSNVMYEAVKFKRPEFLQIMKDQEIEMKDLVDEKNIPLAELIKDKEEKFKQKDHKKIFGRFSTSKYNNRQDTINFINQERKLKIAESSEVEIKDSFQDYFGQRENVTNLVLDYLTSEKELKDKNQNYEQNQDSDEENLKEGKEGKEGTQFMLDNSNLLMPKVRKKRKEGKPVRIRFIDKEEKEEDENLKKPDTKNKPKDSSVLSDKRSNKFNEK